MQVPTKRATSTRAASSAAGDRTESNPEPCRDTDRHLPLEIEVSEGAPCSSVIPGLTDWENY
jgi:hypothetical protein